MPPKPKLSKKKLEQLAEEIRKLRKKKPNLRCADCGIRSTPYVCTTFGIFVCTQCSGLQLILYIHISNIYYKHTYQSL